MVRKIAGEWEIRVRDSRADKFRTEVVVLEVDFLGIVQYLGRRAALSKSGKSTALGGAICVRHKRPKKRV